MQLIDITALKLCSYVIMQIFLIWSILFTILYQFIMVTGIPGENGDGKSGVAAVVGGVVAVLVIIIIVIVLFIVCLM